MGILVHPEFSDTVDNVVSGSDKGFEGIEKRLEVEFFPNAAYVEGLRSLSKSEIDEILSAARCTIVKDLKNDDVDSYVLSESSLFVYPCKIVLKTCGTTKLLNSVPVLLNLASQLSMEVKCCKYTRGTYIFPEEQPYPHKSFADEVNFLDQYFGKLSSGTKSYEMGSQSNGQIWHIYVASSTPISSPVYTVEMCMKNLDRKKAAKFYKRMSSSAEEMTKKTGIANLLPQSEICDFVFDPCGYSMNSLEGKAISTIHVTPESGHSYASFEIMGYGPSDLELHSLISDVLDCFRPGVFSIALHLSGASDVICKPNSWLKSLSPSGYRVSHSSQNRLPGDSLVMYSSYNGCDQLFLENMKSPVLSIKDDQVFGVVDNNLHGDNYKFEQVLSAIRPVYLGSSIKAVDEMMKKNINITHTEDAFYVMDIGALFYLWKTWKLLLPRVNPFYAVKCNSDPQLLMLLATLGAGFDVASKAEIDAVRHLGVAGDRMIFANPCKLPSHIVHAANYNVHLTTFDSEAELHKLKKLNPNADLVLRIRVCDPGARCPLGTKYGAEMYECEKLLAIAKQLSLTVVGVAFHVGSGASDAESFARGITQASKIFDLAKKMGITSLRLLDIGGGFVSDGGHGVSFSLVAETINEALSKYFPPSTGITVIAEPGRYFAEEPYTLATQVFGCRIRKVDGRDVAEYWINDGIYGSMNCLLYDHAILSVRVLRVRSFSHDDAEDSYVESTIFGPTCDGLDTVMQKAWLPHLQCGDWLVFPRMGAYTKSAASTFNGFDLSGMDTLYVYSVGKEEGVVL